MEFAETRKIYQAEYQLLTQSYQIQDHQLVVALHNPIQETMLNTLKADMTTFLRERLKNNNITVTGILHHAAETKMVYTNREKFEHLAEKNPKLLELKDRLGLDLD